MNNNDKLVRLRYAFDMKEQDMVDIFDLGGVEITKEEVREMLTRIKSPEIDEFDENQYELTCNNKALEMFYNGFITYKRGKKPLKPGEVEKAPKLIMSNQNGNNVMMKKLKIALALTSDDMLAILEKAGVRISNSELSAILRKEGHRNYQMCGDKFARNFLKGLTVINRSED
ncbi:DUF1456 family protein [Vagococcus intermedius]|uniref:DUF1456 family protein n=1 Tax=Vagococcus intermedius TaxID=2991418 RepID=A0AAF0I6Q2_9ENTE|nr:DUF1456 family protein [Vagococcus intermedius]WEG72810.1 DUF1456 family protein [Vagococcus intermedius]WEG74896.1 DUF1456 family protein [Vagococcus intermedius]